MRPGTGVLSEEGPRGGPGLQHGTVAEIKDSGEDSGFRFHAYQWPAAPPGGVRQPRFPYLQNGPHLSRSAGWN